MNKDSVLELDRQSPVFDDPLTQLLREGARKLLHQAIELELQSVLAGYQGELDESGKARVVRNGYHPEREIQTGIGPVSVKVPKVRGLYFHCVEALVIVI